VYSSKAWLSFQDVWEMVEKGFEKPIDGAMLTLAQKKVVQKEGRIN